MTPEQERAAAAMKMRARAAAASAEKAAKIAEATKEGGSWMDVPADMATQAMVGINKGAAALPGIPGDIERLGTMLMEKAVGHPVDAPKLPSSADTIKAWEAFSGKLPKAEGKAGEYTESAAEFIPGLALGGGRVVTKILQAIGGGAGAQAGHDIGGPWGELIGGITGLMAPGAIGGKMGLLNTITGGAGRAGRALHNAGLTGDSVKAGAKLGLLPADTSERAGALLRSTIKDSPLIEAQRRTFTDRPVEKIFDKAFAKEINPKASSGAELQKKANDSFDMLRRNEAPIKMSAKIRELFDIPDFRKAASSVADTMPKTTVDDLASQSTMPISTAEDIRNQLTTMAQRPENAAKAKAIQGLSKTLLEQANRQNWSKAVKESQESIRHREALARIKEVSDAKISKTGLEDKLKDVLDTNTVSPGLIDTVRNAQKMTRTSKQANKTAAAPDIKIPPSAIGDFVSGAALTTVSPWMGSAIMTRAAREAISKVAHSDKSTAATLMEALKDPNHEIWKRLGTKKPTVLPAGGLPAIFSNSYGGPR
jgi:hypothetical protein